MDSLLEILIFLPTVGAFIGYVCKWMAIKMLFAPERFVGIGPIGWQGVVQRQAPKFSQGVADTVSRSGIQVDAMLDRLDANELAEKLGPLLDEAGPALLEAALEEVKPGTYAQLAPPVRAQLGAQIGKDGRRLVAKLVDELRGELVKAIDVKKLVIEQLSGPNANRLARLFQRVGRRELQVVIWYGAVLGFLIGLVEVGFYAALERWWLLPIVGAIDGVVNNWLAIQMIFRPLEKKRYLGIFPFQGLFPARQEEISREYGEMLATEVLGPRDILSHVHREAGEHLQKAALDVVDREAAPLVQTLSMMLGVQLTPELKERLLSRLTQRLGTLAESHLPELEAYLQQKLGIAEKLHTELERLPKAEFERVLRGVFEEDEWILVALGGLLGGAIGMLQGALVLWLE